MPSLLELQERFATALESRDGSRERGIDVYRHAIGANYRRALAATYPVVRDGLGLAAFEEAVDAFVVAHPPVSGDLNVYGDAFAAFLEHHLPGRSDVRDMARLEWAIDESSRAADVDSSAADVVAALTVLEEDAVGQVGLTLHPSCRLVRAATAIYDAWSARQRGGTASAERVSESAAGECLLIRRHEWRALVERLSEGEFAWLHALRWGETFADALSRALECDAGFDLERTLSERVHDGTICGVEPGRYNPRHG